MEPSTPMDDAILNGNIAGQKFTFRELATATKDFRLECFIGEGGFGRVFKGQLESGQRIAIREIKNHPWFLKNLPKELTEPAQAIYYQRNNPSFSGQRV